jgi:hypothetical protein
MAKRRISESKMMDQNIRNLSFSINFVLSILILIYLYLAYNYLANLKSCKCAEGKYVEKVKFAESVLMGIVLFWIILSIWLTNNIKSLTRNQIIMVLYLTGFIGMLHALVPI